MRKKTLIIPAIIILIGALAAGYSFLNDSNFYPTAVQNPTAQNQSGMNNDNATPSAPAAPSETAPAGESAVPAPAVPVEKSPAANPTAPIPSSTDAKILVEPISGALSRVTKKPFGIKITPATSPVQPEKFSGYHTGVDFEILLGEEDKDVPIYAICDGTVIYKKYVNGYGGVFIERCKIDGQEVTVLYGHLKLVSITYNLNENVNVGDQIAVLGKGYSQETDGERKHLHLGIYKGTAINLKGYVQTQAELSGWLDVTKYLAS